MQPAIGSINTYLGGKMQKSTLHAHSLNKSDIFNETNYKQRFSKISVQNKNTDDCYDTRAVKNITLSTTEACRLASVGSVSQKKLLKPGHCTSPIYIRLYY